MMGQADVLFCNFLKKSTMLSAIQGYLLWAQSGKVVCRCPIESTFYSQIKVISDTFGVPMVGDTGSVIKVMDTIFQSIPKFNELLNYIKSNKEAFDSSVAEEAGYLCSVQDSGNNFIYNCLFI